MKLRPYQIEAVAAIEREWKDASATLLVLPTGTGKTQVFAEVIRRRLAIGGAMVIAHREELIFQAAARIEQITGVRPGIEMADATAASGLWAGSRIVVSTVQTQNSGTRMERFHPHDFATLVIDEAHHAPADTYRRVIDHYRKNPACKVLGVTATPDRLDEKALGRVFETVAYDYDLPDAITDGWLVPIRQGIHYIDGLDYSEVREVAGELNLGDVARVVENEGIVHKFAWPIVNESRGRKTLVFCVTVVQAKLMELILNRHQERSARFVCGTTPKEERREIISEYAKGSFQYLCNVGVTTEGFDDPGIQCVAMCRPTKSRALYAQMVGRATRALPGTLDGVDIDAERRTMIAASDKPFCEVIDFTGNTGAHKLITAASILGGRYTDDEIDEAEQIIRDAEGDPRDASEALEEARRRAKERADERAAKMAEAAAEEAKKRHVRPRATYTSSRIDPFKLHDLRPPRPREWHAGRELSERQRKVLAARGVNPDEVDYARGKQMVQVIFDRDLPTVKQIAALQKVDWYDGDETFGIAHAKLDRVAANGWRKPADAESAGVEEEVYDDVIPF